MICMHTGLQEWLPLLQRGIPRSETWGHAEERRLAGVKVYIYIYIKSVHLSISVDLIGKPENRKFIHKTRQPSKTIELLIFQ